MEPTSHQPFGSQAGSANSSYGTTHPAGTSATDAHFSTTAAHATGDNPYPADSPAPAASGIKGKLDDALASGKKWFTESGVAEQAQQLPAKAKELGNKAVTSISGLTTTQKAVGVSLLAAGVAFLLTRGGKSKKHGKKKHGEYRDRPRKSPFDHQPSTKDGDHAYDRVGQRPLGASYGSPTPRKPRVMAGSGYAPTDRGHAADHGRRPGAAGPRRDQGPTTPGGKYDAKTSGGQNPNNLDQLSSAY